MLLFIITKDAPFQIAAARELALTQSLALVMHQVTRIDPSFRYIHHSVNVTLFALTSVNFLLEMRAWFHGWTSKKVIDTDFGHVTVNVAIAHYAKIKLRKCSMFAHFKGMVLFAESIILSKFGAPLKFSG